MEKMKPEFVTPEDIYKAAMRYLGTDASPNDEAPDELGCAESVSNILVHAGCIFPLFLSTQKMHYFLKTSPDWEAVPVPKRGDVVISPTGLVRYAHGHTGIVMEDDVIASNRSKPPRVGVFEKNYTLSAWKKYFEVMLFYRKKFAVLEPITPEERQVVEEAVTVSQEAVKHPSLWTPVLVMVGWLERFLATKK